tara:strand:- start:1515 stop:2678 length:1164 start_codon:yes stop_codon:yes gene_type:complete
MAKDKNFQSVSKEANQIWNDATYGLVEETSASIRQAKANMSASQTEAAEVQKFVSARYFKDQDAAAEGIKRGGIRNPSLSTLGNDIIWGIYHSTAAVENATDKKVRQEEGERVSMLEKNLNELYSIIEIGKESDPMFMGEYFGLQENNLPGQVGGMALVGGDTQTWCKTMVIRNGLDVESAKEEYYIGDKGTIRLRYSGGVLDNEIIDKPAVQWLSYDPGIIRDIPAENLELLQTPLTLDEKGEPASILDESSQYNPVFLLRDDSFMQISDDGKTQTEFIPANIQKVLSSIKPQLEARSSAIMKDYTLANIVWRNNFNKEEDIKFTVAPNGNNIDAEQQAEFQKLMFESIKPMLPVVAMGETTEVVKEEVQPEMVEEVDEFAEFATK